MGLLKKKKKKKATVIRSTGGGGEVSPLRPQAVDKLPPCLGHCPSGNDIRGWLTTIAQREKMGLSLDQAYEKAWNIEVETNPFPSVMGRVCPHPCETECNRTHKEGSVAINSVERSIGDFGLEHSLKLPVIENGGPHEEKIAVVGAGPAGLSCAYQLARRGYPVTVYETLDKPGGMLRYGIPEYRLPRDIIDAEVQRIADLGVELKYNTAIGKNITLEELRKDCKAVFVGIGAHVGWTMGIPGEEGPGVYTGTEFLNQANDGKNPEIGKKVVIIGGGDTAIDAARVALRLGNDSDVTILYRRTREEMPAIDREIEEALEEGIHLNYLAAPIKILRDEAGKMTRMEVQRMELGEPDDSGRRRPVPIDGDTYETGIDTLILAVSQGPDWDTLGGGIETKRSWIQVDEWGRYGEIEGIYSGGDSLGLSIATAAIGHGRKAAECIDAVLRGGEPKKPYEKPPIAKDRILVDWYPEKSVAERQIKDPEVRLAAPMDEIDLGITREQAVEEASRCFSCGLCFGCENCWMYCQSNCFKKTKEIVQGHYYDIDLGTCDGCKKCGEECPCGFLDMI